MPATSRNTPQRHARANQDQLKLSGIGYSARRVVCGLWWGLGTILGAISALIGLTDSHFLQFLGAAAITALIGWYDYRIWTFKAKWLMFLIIF